jgi:hypothetical protein
VPVIVCTAVRGVEETTDLVLHVAAILSKPVDLEFSK